MSLLRGGKYTRLVGGAINKSFIIKIGREKRLVGG